MVAPAQTKGGASAPPNVLPFPQTPKALRRRKEGMGAAGFLTLHMMERDGEPIPANVQRFDEPDGPLLPSRSPELLLALLVWSELPAKRKDSIKSQLRVMAMAGKADPDALRLHNLLNTTRGL